MHGKQDGQNPVYALEQLKYYLFSSVMRVTKLALKITIFACRSHCFILPLRKTPMIIHASMCEQLKHKGLSILWRAIHPPVISLRCLLTSCGMMSHRLSLPSDLPRFPQIIYVKKTKPQALSLHAKQQFSSLYLFFSLLSSFQKMLI